MFLLVPAHPGSPGQRDVKRLLLLLLLLYVLLWAKSPVCDRHLVAHSTLEGRFPVSSGPASMGQTQFLGEDYSA